MNTNKSLTSAAPRKRILRNLSAIAMLLALMLFVAFAISQSRVEPVEIDEESASFMIANTLWTLVHELGHALIAEFDVPILGNEENVADTIATVALLQQHEAHPDGVYVEHGEGDYDSHLLATAIGWRVEAALDDEIVLWDTHLLDLQRSHNIVCLTYGSNPERYADLPRRMGLPFGRAAGCVAEYERANAGVNEHIGQYGRTSQREESAGKNIAVIYDDPATPARVALLAHLVESRILEQSAARVEALFALPNDLKIVVMNCLGDRSAFWREDLREIIICYEFLERFIYLSRFQHCFARPLGDLAGREDQALECVQAELARE